MKKLLVAGVLIAATASGPTSAADMLANMMVPSKAPPAYAPIPVYSRTGCYLGIEGGGDWGQSRHVDGNPGTLALFGVPITNRFGMSSGLLGGTAGCKLSIQKYCIQRGGRFVLDKQHRQWKRRTALHRSDDRLDK